MEISTFYTSLSQWNHSIQFQQSQQSRLVKIFIATACWRAGRNLNDLGLSSLILYLLWYSIKGFKAFLLTFRVECFTNKTFIRYFFPEDLFKSGHGIKSKANLLVKPISTLVAETKIKISFIVRNWRNLLKTKFLPFTPHFHEIKRKKFTLRIGKISDKGFLHLRDAAVVNV